MNFIALEEIEPKLLRLAWLGYFYKEKYTETCLNACGTSMESGQYYLPSSYYESRRPRYNSSPIP